MFAAALTLGHRVFVPDPLCEAAASPAGAGCPAVRPAEGLSSDVTVLEADDWPDVTADTSRCVDTLTHTHTHWYTLTHTHSFCPAGLQKKTLLSRVHRFMAVWNSLRAEVANNGQHGSIKVM